MLRKLWQERTWTISYQNKLDSYRTLPACACGIVPNFSNIYDTDHLMDFPQGLNDSYASIRSQILLMDPLPSMATSLSDSRSFPLDQSTMTVRQSNPSRGAKSEPQYHCSICNVDCHSYSCCYSKIGYPSWWKHNLGYNKSHNGPSTPNDRDSGSHSMQAHSIVVVIASSSDSAPKNNLIPSQTQHW